VLFIIVGFHWIIKKDSTKNKSEQIAQFTQCYYVRNIRLLTGSHWQAVSSLHLVQGSSLANDHDLPLPSF